MHINTLNADKIELADAVFAYEYKEALVHQVVNSYIKASHTGTRANKTRSEVRGGGRKPWRQKGTGRARAGSIRSPLARGGGVIFANKPMQRTQKVNRGMYRGAMRSILSELLRLGSLSVIKAFSSDPKTKSAKAMFQKLDLVKKGEILDVLLVDVALDNSVVLATRNLPCVHYCTAMQLNPYDLLNHRQTLITVGAMQILEQQLV